MNRPIHTIGILGGGQLGMFSAQAAKRLGYQVHVVDQAQNCPASKTADRLWVGSFNDTPLLADFLSQVDAVTLEFENIPVSSLEWLEKHAEGRPIAPGSNVLGITQHRLKEKTWLQAQGFPVTPFQPVQDEVSLRQAVETLGTPSVLKTAGFGYDGKGQVKLTETTHLCEVWDEFSQAHPQQEAILEQWVPYELEFSVLVARNQQGQCVTFPPVVNHHHHHILDVSVVPSGFDSVLETKACNLAKNIAQAIGLIGILAVEYFLLPDGQMLINELAPRPHNSGHLTLEAFQVSQYEQHIRAVCNLPLIPPEAVHPAAAMANLLGERWNGHPEGWQPQLDEPQAALHLYGKASARAGRKMGHLTVTGNTPQGVIFQVKALREELTRPQAT